MGLKLISCARHGWIAVFIVLTSVIGAGCVPEQAAAETASPTPMSSTAAPTTHTPEPSVTPTVPPTASPAAASTALPPTPTVEPTGTLPPGTPTETFTALTYNILFGAGVDTQWRRKATNLGFPTDRLDLVLAQVRAADPDIVALEEVVGWTDETIQRTKDALDMPYHVIANQTPGRLTVALFSRYEIAEVHSLSGQVTYGALRAAVQTPGGRTIQVFVAHLNAPQADQRALEMAFLAEQIALNVETFPVLLMGDLNTQWTDTEAIQPLVDAGLCLAAGAGDEPGVGRLDHIWVSSRLAPVEQIAPPPGPDYPSDHPPVAVRLGLYDTPQPCRAYVGGE
jgi:endonuclease/exonuclease/phosphatase family metal-dependent hydrolase